MKMRQALRCVHEVGFVHGDIARRNICRTERGDVFLVDLERCRAAENLCESLRSPLSGTVAKLTSFQL